MANLSGLAKLLPPEAIVSGPAGLAAYDADAYPVEHARPDAVVIPETVAQVQAVVRWCLERGLPFVPRGAGTGLSGGATATHGGVVISTKRLSRVLRIDPANRFAHVQAGATNLAVSAAAEPWGLHYAPDPSSQLVSTIAGNIASNAGGPHTLKVGVTAPHVLQVRLIDSRGEDLLIGDLTGPMVGPDLLSLVIGSEGTLGIIVEAWVRLCPRPQSAKTARVAFGTVRQATEAVAAVLAEGVVPAALELMDRRILGALRAAFGLEFVEGCEALLLIECDGTPDACERDMGEALRVIQGFAPLEVRVAQDEDERAQLWLARKKGVGAMGRLAPTIVTHDGVVPPSRVPDVLDYVYRVCDEVGVPVANIFHAGDGNLHPVMCFDGRDPEQVAKVWRAAELILAECVRLGGSVTGEHGVGMEKSRMLRLMFGEADLRLQWDAKRVFDVEPLCNPGKVFPPEFEEAMR